MTTGFRSAKLWAALFVVVAVTATPRAQILGAPKATATGQEIAATTAPPQGGPSVPQAQQIEPYVVGQAKPPATPGSPSVDLTLEHAIQIALENNLDLQSARINPILQDFSLRSFRASYLPTFTSGFTESNSKSPVTNTVLDGNLSAVVSTGQDYSVGANQNMPWYGGSFTSSFTSKRTASNSLTQASNPLFNAGWNVRYTQPLLANFKIDNTRNNIRTASIQRQITDIDLQNSIENTKASVRIAYWTLRQRIESIEIQRRALELASRQLSESKMKVEIGTVAPIELTNFEVAEANAQTGLLSAEIAWRTQELTFKRLLVNGASDPLYNATINPVDQPLFTVTSVDIQAAVQNALAQRTDIEKSRKQIAVSQYGLDVTKGSTLPTLTLSGTYGMNGSGGPKFTNGIITTPGGYGDALTTLTEKPSWTLGLNFSYQLGMMTTKIALARAELQLEQTKVTQKGLELTITSDVTQAGLNVNNAFRQLDARQRQRKAQESNAQAAQTRFSVGLANPFEVAQALQNLTQARLDELNAIISYLNAVADFDKKQKVGG